MSHMLPRPTPIQPKLHTLQNQTREIQTELPPSYRASVQATAPLDVPQRIEKKLSQFNASQNIFKRWLFEIISCVISAACMGAIIGILVYSQDQPLSRRPLALSINNVLSKIASAALILPISEAIGQLKWAWFYGSKSKELVDFEIFDKASRGAWGSFLLLFRTKGRSLAALGATLTLLLLATDTFFQQVSSLPERWIEQGHGDIPRIVHYVGDNEITYQDGYPLETDELNLRRVTLQYFYYNGTQPVVFGNGTRPDIPLSCPSSRCEWDPYETLGVCSSCSDVSELLAYACYTTRLDWLSNLKGKDDVYPNGTSCGYWLNSTNDNPVLVSGFRVDQSINSSEENEALLLRILPLNRPVSIAEQLSGLLYGGSIHYKDVYAPFLDTLIISAADGSAESVYQKKPPIALECILTWCVKTIQSSYAWGNYEETIIETFFNETGRENLTPWDSIPLIVNGEESNWVTFKHNYSIYPPSTDPSTGGFGVSNETHTRTEALFEDVFPSMITVANRTSLPNWRIRVSWWSSNYIRVYKYCPWLAPNDINLYMKKFATAMTDSLRSHKSAEYLPGRAYTQTIFIAVHWEWLSFPLVLLLSSLGFLIATMIKTSKNLEGDMGTWKTSAMPTLIYSLPIEVQRELRAPKPARAQDDSRAKKVKIQLVPSQGWRVSGHSLMSPTSRRGRTNHPPPNWI